MTDWPFTVELNSADGLLAILVVVLYRLIASETKYSRTNIRLAVVYFLGPTLLAIVALRWIPFLLETFQ